MLADWLVLGRQPLLRAQPGQPLLGPLPGPGAGRAGRRRSATRTRRSTPSCSTRWRSSLVENHFDAQALDPRDHGLGDLPAVLASRTRPTATTSRTTRGRGCGGSRPRCLLDMVCQATGVPRSSPACRRASGPSSSGTARSPHYFLSLFGRPVRVTACECERNAEPGVGQVLHLLNSPAFQAS